MDAVGDNSPARLKDNAVTFQPGGRSQEVAMNWLILVVAGLFEIGWAIGLKLATP